VKATSTARARKSREQLRASGMRPLQIWVPDTKAQGFSAECKRQSLLVAKIDQGDEALNILMDEALQDIEGWEA
jgi:hypothetical protein